MINHKPRFFLAIGIIIIFIVLNMTYPNNYPLGESLFQALNIPIRFAGGFHTVGIVSTILFIIAMTLLVISLTKHKVKIVILTWIAIIIIPSMILTSYQQNIAKGVYAIDYHSEESVCDFDMGDSTTLIGDCTLIFQNHGKDEVTLSFEFIEFLDGIDDPPMLSLLNGEGNEVKVSGRSTQTLHIEKEINVSKMTSYVESGQASGFPLKIYTDHQQRVVD